jgi:D-apiose dehydrogenase
MLRGGLIGCGFFARNHLNAWRDVDGAEIVALCDTDEARLRERAAEFGVGATYGDAETMLREAELDFVDVVTQVGSHRPLVELAARQGIPVICQKPLAPSLEDARAMVEACRAAGVPFMVHENFRWQRPMRETKRAADSIGELFFGRIQWRTAWDVYTDQPYLATDERFILSDIGVHLLDLARFFMGEAAELRCLTQSVNPRVRGEDVATVLLRMRNGAACVVDMSFASHLEREMFPQTLIHLEGAGGSVVLDHDFELAVTTPEGTQGRQVGPGPVSWAIPLVQHVQESVIAIQQHWSDCLRAGQTPETSGADNLKTLELVFGSYDSAEQERLIELAGTSGSPDHIL